MAILDGVEGAVVGISDALNHAGSIVSQTGSRITRESFLMGQAGGVKLQCIWKVPS
jgi:hypothetical protein